MGDFDSYDTFRRFGIFDKCNGRDAVYNHEDIDGNLCIAAYFDGYDNNEVKISPPIEKMKIVSNANVIHYVFTERVGEVEGMFRPDGTLLGIWCCNDAHWRQEYFGPFIKELGFEVINHWDGEWEERLIEAAKENWGLSDFDVEPPL